MKRKRGSGALVGIKIGMNKVYDKMKWGLILQVLTRLGFSTQFCNKVHQCLSTVSYSILLNGFIFGHFTPSKGLR